MDQDDLTKYLGSLAYWAAVGGIAVFVTMFAGPRQDIQFLTYAVIAMAAILVQSFYKFRKIQNKKAIIERQNDAFILELIWSIIRRSLVADHDKYCYEYGYINNTQRTVWMSDYDSYELLCEKLQKHNGVIDSYKKDILDLPSDKEKSTSHDGKSV